MTTCIILPDKSLNILAISNFGSVALYGKMLLVRIVENIKINAYFRAG